MRVPWVPLGSLAVLLLLCLPATGALGEGGVDPRVPSGLYKEDDFHPCVDFQNVSIEQNNTSNLKVHVSYKGDLEYISQFVANFTFTIYGWAMYGKEEALSGDLPKFRYFDENMNMTVESLVYRTTQVLQKYTIFDLIDPEVVVPSTAMTGFYRVNVSMKWQNDTLNNFTARSKGTYLPGQWEESIKRVRENGTPIEADYLISEAGFTVVPEHFNEIRKPNKVPDFGNFTTPVIRPGESGKYNFTVTNRYGIPIKDVLVTVEFYMWATIEDAKPIEDLDGPPPLIEGEGHPFKVISLDTIAPGESKPVKVIIKTKEDTPKGTFFVRHRIEFVYEDETFIMASRGFFTWDQWEGFDYSNLYYQLLVSGIVPDSSFSVKDPVPLWPLATLIVLCVLFGALAVVFYLAEEHGDQYPRLKKGLQFWTGRWEQWKRLMQQRMDELRGEDWEKGGAGSSEEAPEEGPGETKEPGGLAEQGPNEP